VEYIRALESGDTAKVAEIVAEKQNLRDATTIVANTNITATSVLGVTEELKQVWDSEVLGQNPLI
jgi:hypothetical protein